LHRIDRRSAQLLPAPRPEFGRGLALFNDHPELAEALAQRVHHRPGVRRIAHQRDQSVRSIHWRNPARSPMTLARNGYGGRNRVDEIRSIAAVALARKIYCLNRTMTRLGG